MKQKHSFLIRFFTGASCNASEVHYTPGQTLAQAVYLSGIMEPPALCSGIAMCKKCRMRLEQGTALTSIPQPLPEDVLCFTEQELAAGWRLGCRHSAFAGVHIELPEGIIPLPPMGEKLPAAASTTAAMLAVDLGTTSMEWQLITHVDASTSRPVQDALIEDTTHGLCHNPQAGAGSDVISRLAAGQTPSGKKQLQQLTLESLQRCIHKAEAENDVHIDALCLAANPAMTALTLGLDTTGLARAPYTLPTSGGEWHSLPALPPLWVPPQLSPFVGGDISAGYAAIALSGAPVSYPFLLADMGTNGEFLLALSPSEAITASVALGPALEGIGLACGTEASPGAITGFFLGQHGLHTTRLPGASEHTVPGITGTGYLSLISILLKTRCISKEGHFTPNESPMLRRFFSLPAEDTLKIKIPVLRLPHNMFLTATDVEELLKVKAAFSLGLQRMLATTGVTTAALQQVYVAGSLGRYVEKEALEVLGFFPPGLLPRIIATGNTALAGATLLVQHEHVRKELVTWAAGVHSLELADDSNFRQHFAEHMYFSW